MHIHPDNFFVPGIWAKKHLIFITTVEEQYFIMNKIFRSLTALIRKQVAKNIGLGIYMNFIANKQTLTLKKGYFECDRLL